MEELNQKDNYVESIDSQQLGNNLVLFKVQFVVVFLYLSNTHVLVL